MTTNIMKQAWPIFILPVLLAFSSIAFIPSAQAQEDAVKAAPVAVVTASPMDISRTPTHEVTISETTHPLLRLTPDKSEIIHLGEPAQSLIVGNPTHLNILMDSATTLVLVPREPGATHFTVLNKDGKVTMQRHVIVGSPAEKYVRIRRSCMNAGGGDCETTSVYYCPDMCHEVNIMTRDQGQPETIAASRGSTASFLPPETDKQ